MFRILASILLLLSFTVQVFRGTYILVDYYVNQATYVKNCVNKSRPAMHCKGKCQMVKKMQEQEKKDAPLPARKYETNTDVTDNLACRFLFEQYQEVIPVKLRPHETWSPLRDMSYDFFQPPRA